MGFHQYEMRCHIIKNDDMAKQLRLNRANGFHGDGSHLAFFTCVKLN